MNPLQLALASLTLIASIATPAASCSPVRLGSYAPKEAALADLASDIPEPEFLSVYLTRGAGSPDGYSCRDLGFGSLRVKLPDGDTRNIEQFGLEATIVAGTDKYHILQDKSYAIEANSTHLEGWVPLHWGDEAPTAQTPINMEVELRFIYGTRKGPPVRVTFKD